MLEKRVKINTKKNNTQIYIRESITGFKKNDSSYCQEMENLPGVFVFLFIFMIKFSSIIQKYEDHICLTVDNKYCIPCKYCSILN